MRALFFIGSTLRKETTLLAASIDHGPHAKLENAPSQSRTGICPLHFFGSQCHVEPPRLHPGTQGQKQRDLPLLALLLHRLQPYRFFFRNHPEHPWLEYVRHRHRRHRPLGPGSLHDCHPSSPCLGHLGIFPDTRLNRRHFQPIRPEKSPATDPGNRLVFPLDSLPAQDSPTARYR